MILLIISEPQEQHQIQAEIGTFEMAKAMKDDGVYLFISKKYSINEWTRFVEENRNLMERVVHASCQSELEAQGLLFTLENIPEIRRVYLTTKTSILSENFKKFVERVKKKYPTYAIMVGKALEQPQRVLVQDEPEIPNVWLWSTILL